MIISDTSGSDFQKVPPGTTLGICIQLVDLGTQEKGGQYPGLRREVRIAWECPSHLTDEGEPMVIGKRYTMSLGDKARLRADLESWRSKKFTAEELAGFEAKAILGKPCLLTVVHSDDGKYANVQAVTSLPSGMEVPKRHNELVHFSLDEPVWSDYDRLSDFWQETIAKSPEYKALRPDVAHEGAAPPAAATADNFDDDIPF